MPSACPVPDSLKDGMINVVKDLFADHMTMVKRPSTNHRVEFCYQLACSQVLAFFDTLSDLAEERLDALLRWGDEELATFSSAVFPYRLAEKVETLFDMRDYRLLY